jgi:hypothetical protein
MTKLTNYLESKLANHVLKNTAYTPPTTLYVALHTADPTEVGNVGEVTTGTYATYARKAITLGTESGGSCTNSTDLTWDNCPAMTISHISVWDSLSGGNALFYGPLNASKTPASGDSFRLVSGSLSIGFD